MRSGKVVVACAFVLVMALSSFAGMASAIAPPPVLKFINADGSRRIVSFSEVSANGKSISIRIQDSDARGLYLLVDKYWADKTSKYMALETLTFSILDDGVNKYYKVWISDPSNMKVINFEKFSLSQSKALYSLGSDESVKLQRPMYVSLKEIPHDEKTTRTETNANGSWKIEDIKRVQKLAIEFNDMDHSGQQVTYNASWLENMGFSNPRFYYENGMEIASRREGDNYSVFPEHFSILYTFDDSYEGFTKLTDYSYSDVYWDSANTVIGWTSDRRDAADEIMNKAYTNVYPSTEWFKLLSFAIVMYINRKQIWGS